MSPRKLQKDSAANSIASSLGEFPEPAMDEHALALLALSHTPVEHQLYQAMMSETVDRGTRAVSFSARRLMALTGLKGYTSIRRGLAGLINKLSIERLDKTGNGEAQHVGAVYLVFSPEEIFERRRAVGQAPFPKEVQPYETNRAFGMAIARVVGLNNLSRREAQVALCCAEGLTNAEIGEKLHVSEQTVKFHLRNIFVKFGVKRRTELVSHLLAHGPDLPNYMAGGNGKLRAP